MADIEVHGFGPEGPGDMGAAGFGGRMTRIVNLAGAAMSVALVGGLAVWGWNLLVRDVTGIPVVQAVAGPMRVQPADPGGDRAAHQGLAVNRIAALGEAAPPPDQIVLAPRSTDLQPEDISQGMLATQPALLPAAPAVARAPAPADPLQAAILAVSSEVMEAEADLSGDLDGTALAQVIPASVPGPARSPRPRPRPEGDLALHLASASALAAIAAPAVTGEVDPAALGAGTLLVQFGAFDTADDARRAWDGLAGRFGALMEGKDRVIEQAEAAGRTFYRLRALGFADQADARRFCAAFVAEAADCIPVTLR